MENLLEVKNLCKNYGDFSLKNVGFTLPKGFIMGFIGKNGAGKTTTIRSILNMAHIDSGEIKVFELDSIKESYKLKQRIGVVFDDIFFAHHLNVKQIESQLRGFYDNWDSKEFFRLISNFGLPLCKKVGDFSRGMKMKLMVSAALSHKAELLILDEPTSGLDPVARDELLDILAGYIANENRGILFSTHITADLKRIADYITVLNNGTVWFSGTKDELIEKYIVIKCEEKELPDEIREKTIGFHSYQNGFEALLPAEHLDILPKEIEYEKADMDEILIYISKEAQNERNR
ncbi:MAG: ABC transporter ATP-binding protein [Bacillota bacterium]|nr:ABC transporter ATP-binding protein [Bacillota bacterium]